MFQFRPQGASVSYNTFSNPFYSVHRDLAYVGTTIVASSLKFLDENKEKLNIDENELAKLAEICANIFTKQVFNSNKNFDDVLYESGYCNLNNNLKKEFENVCGRMCLHFIFNSIKEANFNYTDQNLATYDAAWKNLMELEFKYSFFRLLFLSIRLRLINIKSSILRFFSNIKNKILKKIEERSKMEYGG